MASNQAEPRLADPWISAVDEGQLPDNWPSAREWEER